MKHEAGYIPVKRKVSCLFVSLFSFKNRNLQQSKLIFLKGQKPFIPHPAQLIGHSAAVYGKKIRKLLSVEGNGNGTAVFSCSYQILQKKDSAVVVDEEAAAIVRQIFEWKRQADEQTFSIFRTSKNMTVLLSTAITSFRIGPLPGET